jgi:hypothetical protein
MRTRTITAVYDNESQALRAYEELVGSGLNAGDVRVVSQNLSRADASSADKNIWESLADFVTLGADRPLYAESLRRGGYLLSARVNDEVSDQAMSILERTGPVDLDARTQQWRDEGWSPEGLGAPASMHGYAPGAGPTTESVAEELRSHAPALDEQAREEPQEETGVWTREPGRGSVRVRSYSYESRTKN